MTDIYGYAAAAPMYRAAGWMQVTPPARRPQDPAAQRFHGTQPQTRHRRTSTGLVSGDPEREHGNRHPRRRIGVGHRRRTRPSGQGGRGERHQRTLSGTGHASGHVEQHGARHRQSGTPPVLQGARRPRVEGRRHRGSRHPAARPPVFRGLAVDPPERRNVLLVHAKRRILRHAPPYRRLGDTAMEVGGLPAQTRQSVEFDHFNSLVFKGIRRPHVQGGQHVPQQDAHQPGKQRLKA